MSNARGTVRVVWTALLILLIGAAGAFFLPGLLQFDTGGPSGIDAAICFEAPSAEGARATRIHLGAQHGGRSDLQLSEAVAPHVDGPALATYLAQAAVAAGWADVSGAGGCVNLRHVTAVDVDGGDSGLALSISVAARNAQGHALGVFLDGAGPGRAGRVDVTLGGAASTDDRARSFAAASATFGPADPPAGVIAALAARLGEGGVRVKYVEGATELRVLGLGASDGLSTLILGVTYSDEAGERVPWSWGITR